jgi:hypothetical protein
MTKITFKGFARRKKRKQDRRDSIAQAAIRVMCEKGYEQTTMQDIAEAADFSTSSVYYYFESKIAILEEVISILTIEFSDTVENSLSVESSKEFNLNHYVDQINYFGKINLVIFWQKQREIRNCSRGCSDYSKIFRRNSEIESLP